MVESPHFFGRETKGQLSIDYIVGALIFFGAVIFLVSGILNTLPQFDRAQRVNELQLAGWSITEILMEDTGRWSDSGNSGTDWHTRSVSEVDLLGLKGEDGISEEKVREFLGMGYSDVKSILETEKDFNIRFTEFVDVDTHRSFPKNSPPPFITEPDSSGPYGGVSGNVHYGSERINSAEVHFLLGNQTGYYNALWVSRDWDFSNGDTDFYDVDRDVFVPVGDSTYVVEVEPSLTADGNIIVMRRDLGRTGRIPPEDTGNIVQIKRFGVMEGNVLRAVFVIW